MVSNLDLVFMIFTLSLSNNSLATSAKCLGGTIINVYRNYDGFCIGSALSWHIYIHAVIGFNLQEMAYVRLTFSILSCGPQTGWQVGLLHLHKSTSNAETIVVSIDINYSAT